MSFQIFNGAITQNSGVITAATFSATADNGLDLDGENLVAQLDRLAVGGTGDITFRNAGALVLTGDIIAAGDSVNLYSTSGAITQNSGAITANRLTARRRGGHPAQHRHQRRRDDRRPGQHQRQHPLS